MTLLQRSKQFFDNLGFQELTPVQQQVYPLVMALKDVIVQSATGTGKTHAFLFPMMDKITSQKPHLQGLIIVPTRELAQQVYQFALQMKEVDANLCIQLLIGGKDRQKMIDKVEQTVHLAIGTPGRVQDLIEQGALRIDQVSLLVVDEVDMIWEYGFMNELLNIFSRLSQRCQVLAFSATLKDQLVAILKKSMNTPKMLVNQQPSRFNPNIQHVLIDITGKQVDQIVFTLLTQQQIAGCIIFTNTRQEAAKLTDALIGHGLYPLQLHGDLTFRQRKQTLSRIQDVKHPLLVATDIAARGLDLPYVSTIISVGLPSHLEFYTHRSGRTGRIGKQGTVYTLVTKENRDQIQSLSSTGIAFNYQKLTQNGLVAVQNFFAKKKMHKKVDAEILSITKRKKQAVKPNYKKKRKQAIEKIVRTKRREMIREEIKAQKKARAKQRMRYQSEN